MEDRVMKSRKYVYYILMADFGEIDEVYWSYREACSKFGHCDEPKTLYGVDDNGKPSVIFSK